MPDDSSGQHSSTDGLTDESGTLQPISQDTQAAKLWPAARMGHPPDFQTSPSTPPIFQTAAFDVEGLQQLQELADGTVTGHIYTRDSNPNHSALAESIARMEGTAAGAVFASGMAAISSVFLTLGQPGGHVVMSQALYGRTLQLAERFCQQFCLQKTLVDQTDPQQFAAACRPETIFALVETISNPLLDVADIPAITQQLGQVPLIVDATFTTPELFRCCEHGAAIVVHSASKYLNGHGDVMLGVAAGSQPMMKRLLETASVFGSNANPFESWLCQRGLKTLSLRMQHICVTTRKLAEFLQQHPAVRRVYHPLLPTHRSYGVACRLYPNGTGGIVSFELHGESADVVNRFMKHSPAIPFSPTLADARTTISYPAGTSHRFLAPEDRAALGITNQLIRLSVGLESFEQLRSELQATLDQL